MNYCEAKAKAIARMTKEVVELDDLKKAVIEMNDDLTISDDAFLLGLDCLQERMDEAEYIDFLETL